METSFLVFSADFDEKETLNATDAIAQKKKIHSSHASISYERERETDLLSLLLLLFLLSIPPPAIPHNPSCKKGGKDGWREREREREISALPWVDG